MAGCVIPHALGRRLLAETAASPGSEICGLLFGAANRIEAAWAAANVAADPTRHFEVDPAMLIAAHKAQRGGGARLIGCYHSHPNGDPTPSRIDLDSAERGALWLVLAGDHMRLWIAGETAFDEVPLLFD